MTFEDNKKLYLNNRVGVLEVEDEHVKMKNSRPGLMVKDMKKMKNNRPGLMVKDLKKMKEEWTFFLCYPSAVCWYKIVGEILTEFEKMGLNIIGMRLMHGSVKFLTTHFLRDAKAACFHRLMQHLTSYPFIAMILEGENAIEKALQLRMDSQVFQESGRPKAYSSHSYESAVKDYELWFGKDADNWKEEIAAGNHLACAFPDGTGSGPTAKVMENILRVEPFITLEPNFADNFYKKDLSFLLIRPLAFQKRCVGEVLSVIERSCFHLKGLKLVRKSEAPHSNAWLANRSSSSEIKEDEYGIAMLACHIEPEMIQIVNKGDGCIRKVNNTEKTEICSNLIYLGKPGDRENIQDFFEFGCVSWVDPIGRGNRGRLFVATLSSLQFEECDA
ncbi:hypothetical protein MKW94_028898 [Papaver nudicaule]|uniref:nucleoside-diphosphate kinase n=1 Tax=Papaver nudicaule TaxID=74823 RepID=A0AA41SLY7_PAPNU|nr:hypothetical protein [Papaver nudicaule]